MTTSRDERPVNESDSNYSKRLRGTERLCMMPQWSNRFRDRTQQVIHIYI